MAHTAYRKASQDWGLWIGACLAGVAGEIAVIVLFTKTGRMDSFGLWDIPFIVGPFILALLIGWRLIALRNRARMARLADRIAAQGFRIVQRPSEAARTEFAAPLLHFFPTLELRLGTMPIQWMATQNGPTPALLFEHECTTGSGKFTAVHQHTVLAWPTGHSDIGNTTLPMAPWFLLARFPYLRRRAETGTIEVPGFDHRAGKWSMFGDAETGAQFLTPSVRAALSQAPMGEVWSVGAGWICCNFNGTLDGNQIDHFFAHARAVVA